MLIAQYDSVLVVISILVAILASYTALDMAGRIHATARKGAVLWLIGGAIAMGIGIWSMHFIGMLSFRLPIPLGYEISLTIFSLVIAVVASGFALWRVSQPVLPVSQLCVSAVMMGSAIATMHYMGMAAMQMRPGIEYDPTLFALSVVIAITASGAALWIAFILRKNTPHVILARMGAALVMGAAIIGMHYTGMAAANFPIGSVCGAASDITPGWLALVVIVVTLAILAIALLTSVLDSRLESQTSILAKSLALANQELTQQALQDNLTKLPNRTLLEDRLDQMLRKASREHTRFALMFLDLDGFKAINDSLGHHVGDLLLIEVANRIRNSIRGQDTAARLGGDEFVILIEIAEPEDAATVAEKLCDLINKPFYIENQELGVSASIGITIYPEDGRTPHDLLINADAAMYHTKSAGRNGYHFFESSMNINVHNQLQLIQDLRHALENKEFVLHYQPKYDASNGQVVGMEALLRWQHPARGLLAPGEFIAVAERTGLILPIGDWVLDEACRQMRIWFDTGYTEWKVAVNLSAIQFSNGQLVEHVSATLKKYALPAHCLILEVTESTAMQDVESSMTILTELAVLGIDISIDDFGTGYSSLLYLKRLPACELKIDRGFINNLAKNTDDESIVSAIVALGHSLNLRIVAEGVETEKQQDMLKSLGCDTLQGYLLGRPVAPAQLMLNLDEAPDAPARSVSSNV
ncbi:MAG: EAL domain-containing protein [Oxalicibacterium faecigallinarum]|uniref:putative bifunctional diguanylate cyclase/phosphodiesterase n=1 Tax=Oxalicibacterium faecigallinarum TaxID=573741 RepID=UPI002809C44A|nr:EAL domain-containing protein [Oxalicibacterium faecigallinarum]MDQ7968493.1 EAL domain-containing protein [Oxalicibacterium faecigallinarum]